VTTDSSEIPHERMAAFVAEPQPFQDPWKPLVYEVAKVRGYVLQVRLVHGWTDASKLIEDYSEVMHARGTSEYLRVVRRTTTDEALP
jgi:hypothetical protein